MPPVLSNGGTVNVSATTHKFRNIILCDDIREETHNKKSLMGVFGGDVVVAAMPATINIAVYAEYDKGDDLISNFELRLVQDETEIAKASLRFDPQTPATVLSLVLPRAMVIFEKDCVFKIVASVDGSPEVEILSKRVFRAPLS